MMPLHLYRKIKDNYCIAYYGTDSKLIKKLVEIKKNLEEKYSGIKILIACKDEYEYLFLDTDYFIKRSNMLNNNNYNCFKEIKNMEELENLII